jgi:hypothetical protein
MATIGELIINLNASTAAFVTELSRVKNLSFETAAQVQRSFSLIGAAALGMIGVAAGALAEGIHKTVEWETHILHLAQSSGMSVEALSGLSYAAKLMGIEVDQVALAMERFDKQLIAAQLGNKKAEQNMSLLGIDPASIKTSDEALKLLAEHFAKMPDGVLKTGEAMLAFGKAGAAMIPILNLGKKGLQDFLDEAKAMGIVITKDQAEAAERFEQNIVRMKESLHGLWVEITNATIPVLNDLMDRFADTKKTEGFFHAIGNLTFALTGGIGAMSNYLAEGEALGMEHDKVRKTIMALTAKVGDQQKAVDALKKSTDAIITSLRTQIATLGMNAEQVQVYKIRTDAAKLGVSAWGEAEIALYQKLQKRLNLLQQFAVLDTSKRDEEKKNFLADKLAADTGDLEVLRQQLDVLMRMEAIPQLTRMTSAGPNDAFTASIEAQTAALQYEIETFGMSREALERYHLAQLDSSDAAKQQIANFKLLQERMSAMSQHARVMSYAWYEFGRVADRALNDLIFSGKKFTQVLADVTKMLGEMFLKWALFGPGGGGGLFGSLFGSLSKLFGGLSPGAAAANIRSGATIGFAGGGPVSANVPIMVGEKGPEIFNPGTSGTIIPNGTGIAGGPRISIVYQIDARGSSITEEQFARSLQIVENRAVARALQTSREVQLRTA